MGTLSHRPTPTHLSAPPAEGDTVAEEAVGHAEDSAFESAVLPTFERSNDSADHGITSVRATQHQQQSAWRAPVSTANVDGQDRKKLSKQTSADSHHPGE